MATTNKAFRVKTGLIVQGAALETAAGTTAYPPILLTSGTNLTTATAGAFEYDGTSFYLTASTGGRKTIAFTDLIPAAGTSTTLGTIKLASDTAQTVAFNAVSATASRSYGLQVNASGQGIVNVPWTDTVYTLPTATASALGGIELFSGTTQTTAANAVTTTASRTYGLQLNSDLQGVVNVPWTDTDTNWYPTTFAYTGGTTAGPTGSLTGTGMSAVSFGAIPSAAVGASGVVTTGAQEFGGTKTLTSPAITTSLTTGSTTFALVNTTATTVNFAGAATTVSVGAATGNTTVNNNLIVTGDLTVQGNTTTINTSTLDVEDIEIVLGNVASPTNTTANGGGIRLEAGTDVDKTFSWSSTGANWTSSENLSLATGKTYKINNSAVISGTAAALVIGEGASTTIAIGAAGGTATILNPTVTLTNATALNMNGSSPTIATVSTGTASVFNTTASTVNLGGESTTLNLGTGTFSTLRTINIGSASSGTGNAQTINLGVNSTTTATSTINIGGSTSTTTTVTGTVKLPTVGTSGFVKLGTGGELSADTNTYVQAASPALTGTPTINSIAGLVTASGSTTGTTALTLSTVYASGTYNGGEFIVKATNSTNIEITKVLVITDGTNVYMTTYGDVFVSSDLVSIDFTYTGANVNMVVTPVAGTTGTTTVKVTGTLVAV